MIFLLDTNICIDSFRQKSPYLARRLAEVAAQDVAISVITYCELLFGALRSQRVDHNLGVVERLRLRVPVLPMNDSAAHSYAVIRAHLEQRGLPIGANDLLIAAHALSIGASVVTNNEREFQRVPGLRVENWTKP